MTTLQRLQAKAVELQRDIAREADREMHSTVSEEEFGQLHGIRARASWSAECGNDHQWMAEQRMEAMMLGEWDNESGTPNWQGM